MGTVTQDIKYGWRMLAKSPGFTLVAVLTLALGIGANTAIFSLTDQILLRTLPIVHPEELVLLRSPGRGPGHVSTDGDEAASFSYPTYKDLREQATAFNGLIARYSISLNVAARSQSATADGELVSGNYFQVLGVTPALGRILSMQDETAPGANPVAVLSYGYWMKQFGGSAGALNQVLVVNGTPLTVVGVTRPGFTGVQVGQTPDMFIPITMKAQMTPSWDGMNDRKDHWVAILGRLKRGMNRTQTESAIQGVYHSILEAEAPAMGMPSEELKQYLARHLLLQDAARGRPVVQNDVQMPLLVLLGMVGLLLLITCANVASLMVARGVVRQREVAVRLAMGARTGQIIRQLLIEAIMLSLVSGVAGVVLGAWILRIMVRAVSTGAGIAGLDANLDWRVMSFALGLSLLAAAVFGLAPALGATKVDLHEALKEQGSRGSSSASTTRLRRVLIVAQVMLTTVLLVSAGLFVRSLHNLKSVDIGIKPDHVIQFTVAPGLNGYSPEKSKAWVEQARQALNALPGIEVAGAATIPVFSDDDSGGNVTVEGYTPVTGEDIHVFRNWTTPHYLAAMGTPLVEGREISESDTASSQKVALINQLMARKFFPGRDPIGMHFAFGGGKKISPDIQIIGVVADSKHDDSRSPVMPFAFFPITQKNDLTRATFYIRTKQDPRSVTDEVRKTVMSLDPNLPIAEVKMLSEQVEESMFPVRMITSLSVGLGIVSAILAAIGLYGVMAYSVAQRTREIGIRLALGAQTMHVLKLVVGQGMWLAMVGVGLGLISALGATRVLSSLLFAVKASDPGTFLVVALLLAVVAMLANYIPARRAIEVDPMVALRYE
jgi:putative ABC transport system permease protein